jgi:hypothetical protein
MTAKAMLFGALLSLAVVPAQAQSNSVVNIIGAVEKVDATSITLKDDQGGAPESFTLPPNVLVVKNRPATLEDIRSIDFIASAAVRGADGKLHSTELRIFPASMRGVRERQRPMNDARNQTMTNATVTGQPC